MRKKWRQNQQIRGWVNKSEHGLQYIVLTHRSIEKENLAAEKMALCRRGIAVQAQGPELNANSQCKKLLMAMCILETPVLWGSGGRESLGFADCLPNSNFSGRFFHRGRKYRMVDQANNVVLWPVCNCLSAQTHTYTYAHTLHTHTSRITH